MTKKTIMKPKLLLHSCCAPCSSAVLERLAPDFDLTLYYYNPNLDSPLEFMRRSEELGRLAALGIPYETVIAKYDPAEYFAAVAGLENLGEGSERCYKCYELRLRKTAEYASLHGFDCFTTTLSISPYKKAEWLNEIGEKLEKEFSEKASVKSRHCRTCSGNPVKNPKYLPADFKKKDGYRRSIELSKKLGLYRQDYCGCKFSKAEAAQWRRAKAAKS
jgi:predicted adenine nucleotide alpha hydrolase (AANH) superfamily ATPase